jgi:DNA-binding response OmpR family regulator
MKILVVDGDSDLLDVLMYALRREGFEVAAAADATRALERWAAERPDAAVVDLGLPRGGGFELCRRLRQEAAAPILLLSASGDEDELVRGLQLGADDFMTKPLSLKLLAARLRALLRRRGEANPYERAVGEVRAGDLVLNLETHAARNRHGAATLTPLEFKVLYLLAMNEGRVIPYARLVDYVWGFEGGDANVLKSHVCHIRQKLRLPAAGPGSITALFGVGYSLVKGAAPADAQAAPEAAPSAPREVPEPSRRLPLRRRLAARQAGRLAHARLAPVPTRLTV